MIDDTDKSDKSEDTIFDIYVLLKDKGACLDSSFRFEKVVLLNNIICGKLYIDTQIIDFEIDSYSILFFDHFTVGEYLFNVINKKYIVRVDYSFEKGGD
jgi:hypothetical protein